jgi:hypothetical protein
VQNCHNDLADLARERGDMVAARAGFRAALRWAQDHGWQEYAPIGRVNLALVAVADDDPEAARAEAELLVEALSGARNHWLRPFAEVLRAWSFARSGDGEEALRRMRLAVKRGVGAQADPDLAWALGQLATQAESRGWTDLGELARREQARAQPRRGG